MKIFTDIIFIGVISFIQLFTVMVYTKRQGALRVLLLILLGHSFLLLLKGSAFQNGLDHIAGIALLFENGTGMFEGPMIYFFCQLIIGQQTKLGNSFLLYLVPYFITVVAYSFPMTIQFLLGMTVWYSGFEPDIHKWSNLFDDFFFLLYAALCIRLLQKIGIWSKKQYADLEKRRMVWLQYLVVGMAILVIADIFLWLNWSNSHKIMRKHLVSINLFGYFLLYIILGYKGLFQSFILLPEYLTQGQQSNGCEPDVTEQKIPYSQITTSKNHKQNFTLEDIVQLNVAPQEQLEEKHLFLNQNLKLNDVCEVLGVSEKRLSHFINEIWKVNFFILINRYRVKEVQRKINSNSYEQMSLMGIAYDAGFPSKPSIFRIFKQKTGNHQQPIKNKVTKCINQYNHLDCSIPIKMNTLSYARKRIQLELKKVCVVIQMVLFRANKAEKSHIHNNISNFII